MVDPVADEMLAEFVVDSHFKSQAKGAAMNNSQDESQASARETDPDVLILISLTLKLMNWVKYIRV